MNYTDIADLVADELTAAQIAEALAASPLTVRSIPKSELRQWLAETGLLRFGLSGVNGWLVELHEGPLADVLDWLADALQNPFIEQIRTESVPEIAGAFALIVAAAVSEDAPDNRPLSIEAINDRLASWTGGQKHADVTAESVQALIDNHVRQQAVAALANDLMGAIQLETENPNHTIESVRAAMLAVLED